MILSQDPDFPKLEICTLDDLPRDGRWAVAATDPNDESKLLQLHSIMQDRLIVPEIWKDILPNAPILISSAISGGTAEERFRSAAKERRCWLLLEPIRATFPLPFPDGRELPTTHLPEHGFFSSALCCYYAHFHGTARNHVVLWDTEESLAIKIQLAKEAGFCGFTTT